MNTIKKLDIPPQVLALLFSLAFIFFLSPYLGGSDFGVIKLPTFNEQINLMLKIIGPVSLIGCVALFLPIWKNESASEKELQNSEIEKVEKLNSNSKHIVQSTPDIVKHELERDQVNTGGIEISLGFNINDLRKRISILNPNLLQNDIENLSNKARAKAFTDKYADPKEDEKLIDNITLQKLGIQNWNTYLEGFLIKIGVNDVKNISVLDVGIGNAHASFGFLQNCSNLFGIDVSEKALDYAKSKLPSAILSVGSAENLVQIESFSIDLYISLRTYQSTLFDMKQSLHEAWRVLASGGRLVVSIPTMYFTKNEAGEIDGYAKGLIPPNSDEPDMKFALGIAQRISWYLEQFGFRENQIDDSSPYEIFVGGIK